MWQFIATEMELPWKALEAIHWEMGEKYMARRANVVALPSREVIEWWLFNSVDVIFSLFSWSRSPSGILSYMISSTLPVLEMFIPLRPYLLLLAHRPSIHPDFSSFLPSSALLYITWSQKVLGYFVSSFPNPKSRAES
jgi:hypothetical protein